MRILKLSISFLLILLFVSLSDPAFAQTQIQTQTTAAAQNSSNAFNIMLIVTLIVLFHLVFIPLIFGGEATETGPETGVVKKKSILVSIKDALSGATPLEEEGNIILDEDYDGIRELDNKVPPWFNILFYGTIIFAFVYMLDYHVFNTGKLPFQEYSDEVMAAELQRQELIRTGALINEENVEALTDPEALKMGKQIFTVNCVQCHGNDGQGSIGPNLTDQYWIHGGGVKNVFKTVKYGVPLKGMIAWQNQFNPRMIQQVVSYVLTLQGTNPSGGKAPEGNLYVQTDSLAASNDSLKTDSAKTKVTADTVKAGK